MNDDDLGVWESSPLIAGGESFSHTSTSAGTYLYYCKPHFYNEAMRCTIAIDQ